MDIQQDNSRLIAALVEVVALVVAAGLLPVVTGVVLSTTITARVARSLIALSRNSSREVVTLLIPTTASRSRT